MGSASREALAKASQQISGVVSNRAGGELLAASSQFAANPALLAAVLDDSASSVAKATLIDRIFASGSSDARRILTAAAAENWSTSSEFVDGVEELGIRAEAAVNSALADELLAAAGAIDADNDLELALGSKLSEPSAKAALAERIFSGKISDSALGVVRFLAANPRGRRMGAALRSSAEIAADQGGSVLATVTVAAALSASQQNRLAELLQLSAGRPVRITTVIDPSLIGGVRVQLGDSVIDGSVRSRLEDLRLRLAG